MPAGDLLTAPGQVEWGGLLIDITVPDGPGLWITDSTERSGWWLWTWAPGDDLPTTTGSTPGVAIRQAIYPQLIGVAAETAGALVGFTAAMDPTAGLADLAWWDWATDLKIRVPALARRCEPSTGLRTQLMPHRLVDLQWMVPKPADMEVIG